MAVDKENPIQNETQRQARDIVAQYHAGRASNELTGRRAGDETDQMLGYYLPGLPEQDLELARVTFSLLADSEIESDRLTAALIIDRLAQADFDAASPIWMKLLDADSPVRQDAWETLMGRAANEDTIALSQAAPLILHYLEHDPMPYQAGGTVPPA